MKANDMRPGDKIEYENEVWIVKEVQHRTPGNLRAFVQARITSVATGRSKEERFRSTDAIKVADAESKTMTYLYRQDDMLSFMDVQSYEQMDVAVETLGDSPNYMIDNMDVIMQFINGKAIGVDLPASVILDVIETEPGVKGDTVNNVLKPAKTQTGLIVQVPIFVNEGDRIKVDTRSGDYLGRSNE